MTERLRLDTDPEHPEGIYFDLAPSVLMQAFYIPQISIKAGDARNDDIEDVACKCFLLWRSDYPDYGAAIRIGSHTAEARRLNRFFKRHRLDDN